MSALLMGLTLGFSAGISPGPLTTLIITTTLARGFRSGLRVALAPLITDAPVILIAVLFVGALSPWLQTLLAIVGGLYIIYLGIEAVLKARDAMLAGSGTQGAPPRADWGRGILVNLLSPNPWIFWITIGGPLLVTQAAEGLWYPLLFLTGFYLLLVGSKVALAVAVAGGRRRLSDRSYRLVLAASGLLLVLFGLLLLREALLPAL